MELLYIYIIRSKQKAAERRKTATEEGKYLQGDGLSRQGLHEDLHPTAEAEHQVQSGLLLDVVV